MKSSWAAVCCMAIGAAMLLHCGAAGAESAADLVTKGNGAYDAGDYEGALASYDEASVGDPESPYIYFNRGNVLYRQEDFDKAKEAFEQASLKSKDLALEARSQYNIGNCLFRQGDRQRDSDLQKSLEAFETSVRYYQRALELDPKRADAAHNIEVARLTIKAVLDEIKKQQEEQQQQQQQQQELMKELEQLIERQQQHRNDSQNLAQEQQQGQSADADQKAQAQAGEQEETRNDTESLSQKLSQQQQQAQQQQQQPMPNLDTAQGHVDAAVEKQRNAEKQLQDAKPKGAEAQQQEAVEELEKARDALNEGQQQQQQQGDEQQQQQGEQQEQDGQSEEDKGENEEEQMQAAALDETSRDILDEEEQNREQRAPQTGGYRPVDKDW